MSGLQIRKAVREDSALIHRFITELAVYERAGDEVLATVADIEQSLFGPQATTYGLICEFNQEPVGFAVYFFNFSTWLGKYGIYLEDLYVSPEYRGVGAGKALLQKLAKIAVAKGCGRFEWNVLDWNEPAIQFYRSIGARPQDEWVGYRLTGKALEDFANS